MRDRSFLVGSLVVVLAAGGFGLLGPLARFAYDAGFEPLSFVAWRATFGLIVIFALIAGRASRGVRLVNPLSLPRADGLALAIVALSGLTLNVAMFLAFDLTTVALVLLAFYTYPALVATVAVMLGHERLGGSGWLALFLALGGMVLVVAGGLANGSGQVAVHPLGLVLGLAAAASQTVFVTASRGRFPAVPPDQAIGWVLLVTAAACAALTIATGAALDVPLREPRALGLAIVAGVAAAGIPSVLFLVGIRAIGGTRAGILMLIEPLVGVTLAAILLHEALLPVQIAGGGAILLAAILLQRGPPGAADHEALVGPVVERT